MKKEEAIERLKLNKAAAEFYVEIAQNIKLVENELKDIEAFDMAIEALQAEQTAEWIQPTSLEDCRRLDIRFVRCSKCGEQQIVVGHKGYNELPFKYCPNCRAKMSLQKRVEFTRSYSCNPDDYGAMCAWCEYDDGSKCIKPTKGGDSE